MPGVRPRWLLDSNGVTDMVLIEPDHIDQRVCFRGMADCQGTRRCGSGSAASELHTAGRLLWHHHAVADASGTDNRPGQPRSQRHAGFVKRFDAWMQVPIIVSAILPLVVVPQSNGWVGVVVGVVTWLVFLTDYVVHAVCVDRYWRTGFGWFDLFIVIATAPWFLIPAAQPGQFVVVLRLARLARLVIATKGARRLLERLGAVALVAGGVVVTGSFVAYHAEHATNPEFATVGDALWWGIVTLTTVGYGDIVPRTETGRWAGVVIMVTGVATLGLLAGSLASFFRPDDDGPSPASATEQSTSTSSGSSDAALQALTTEVSALRRQVEVLSVRLVTALGDVTPEPAGTDPNGPGEQP